MFLDQIMSATGLPKDSAENLTIADNTCAVVLGRKIIAVVDLNEPTILTKQFESPKPWVPGKMQIQFNPHGTSAKSLISTAANEMMVWDLEGGSLLNTWDVHERTITGVDWSPTDPNIVATCAEDNLLKLIDARTGRPSAVFNVGTIGSQQVKWNPSYPNMIASTNGGIVKIWDTRMAATTSTLKSHIDHVSSLDWSSIIPDQFVTAGTSRNDPSIKFWSLESEGEPLSFIPKVSAHYVRFTPFGRAIVSAKRRDIDTTSSLGAEFQSGPLLWSLDRIFEQPASGLAPVTIFEGTHAFDWWKTIINGSEEYRMVSWHAERGSLAIDELSSEMQQAVDYVKPTFLRSNSNTAEDEEIDSDVETPTLHQEIWAYRRKQIQGVSIQKVDYGRRLCEVHVSTTTHRSAEERIGLHMTITFPAKYPRSMKPSFIFASDKNRDLLQLQNSLREVLSNEAEVFVSTNRICLRPCLKLAVKTLNDASHKARSLPTRLAQSSRKPNMLQIARCSGASFCGVGKLIFFSNSGGGMGQGGRRGQADETKKAKGHSSDVSLSWFFFRSGSSRRKRNRAGSADGDDLRQERTKSGAKSGVSGRSMANPIEVYELCSVLLLSRHLGKHYCHGLELDSSVNICQINRAVVKENGITDRSDLEKLWSMTQAMTASLLKPFRATSEKRGLTTVPTCQWVNLPCGGVAISGILRHYYKCRDIQTVAVLGSVVMNLLRVAELKFENPKSIKNATLDKDVMASVGWSQIAYSEILFRWGYSNQSTEMRKIGSKALSLGGIVADPCSPRDSVHIKMETCSKCAYCKTVNSGPVCRNPSCRRRVYTCFVCHQLVKLRVIFCEHCGHGGHPECVKEWCEVSGFCPTGCGSPFPL